MMNPDVKRRWVEALRSGRYQQTTGALNRGDSYCCLGVLTELAVEDGVIPPGSCDDAPISGCTSYEGARLAPPKAVYKWAGLGTGAELCIAGKVASPSMQNDARRASFAQIADAIEEQW